MPERGVSRCTARRTWAEDGDVALSSAFGHGQDDALGRSDRGLIGDDEHGWSDDGVFNFEGGCYAKCIKLTQEGEPQIWNAIRFGSVLENVVIDPETRVPDLRRTADHREHARAPTRSTTSPTPYPGGRRAPQERHLPDVRRVRRAAAGRQADAASRRCTTS